MQNLEIVQIKKKVNDNVSADLDLKTMTFGKKCWGGVGELRSISLMKSIMENTVYMSH